MFVVFAIAILAQDVACKSEPLPLGKLIDVAGYRVHPYCIDAEAPPWSSSAQDSLLLGGLVQPEAAKFTQVCSYDHSGIGWLAS